MKYLNSEIGQTFIFVAPSLTVLLGVVDFAGDLGRSLICRYSCINWAWHDTSSGDYYVLTENPAKMP
jgi:hypothetical protein